MRLLRWLFILLLLIGLLSCSSEEQAKVSPSPPLETTSGISSPLPTITTGITTPPTPPQPALSSVPTASPQPTQEARLGDSMVFMTPMTSTTLPNPHKPTTISCEVITEMLDLHQGPGFSYRTLTTLTEGTTILGQKQLPGASWILVETSQHQIGWLNSQSLTCQGDIRDLPPATSLLIPETSETKLSTSIPPLYPTSTPSPISTPTLPPPTPPVIPDYAWRVEYYDNASLLEEPILIGENAEIDFNWFLDSPIAELPKDNFSIRWSRRMEFPVGGDYEFFADVDDGVRVYVDDWRVIDAWHTFTPEIATGRFSDIEAGFHTVIVEYFESGGHAKIRFWTERTQFIDKEWQGEYYNNASFQEPAFALQQNREIDFDWGEDPPIHGMDGNNFSIRWKRTLSLEEGNYRFFAEIGERDKVKIYLDDWLIIDESREDRSTVSGSFGDVGAGFHTITVEYVEDVGRARIKVWWEEK